MKRKFLYALGLLLCLSSVAFSKESARYCGSSGKLHSHPAGTTSTAAEPAPDQMNHPFLRTFIKILYI